MNQFFNKLIKRLNSTHASIILGISVLGVLYLGWAFYPALTDEVTSESNTTINEAPKTEEEVIVDGIIEGVEMISEIGADLITNIKVKDSIYEANRAQYWVYMIGDYTNSKESILRAYNQIESENRNDVRVFKSRDKSYMLFVKPNLDNTKSAFNTSIKSFKNRFGDDIKVVNLIIGKKCDKILQVSDLKKRIDKKKIIVPCYECDN